MTRCRLGARKGFTRVWDYRAAFSIPTIAERNGRKGPAVWVRLNAGNANAFCRLASTPISRPKRTTAPFQYSNSLGFPSPMSRCRDVVPFRGREDISVACLCKRQFRQLTESATSDGEPGEMRAVLGMRRAYAERGFERLRAGEHNCADSVSRDVIPSSPNTARRRGAWH